MSETNEQTVETTKVPSLLDELDDEQTPVAEPAPAADVETFTEELEALKKRLQTPPPVNVALPSDPDDPMWEQVYEKLGRPKAPEGYTFETPEGFELDDVDSDIINKVKQQAFATGVTERQFSTLMQTFLAEQKAVLESEAVRADQERVSQEQKRAEALSALDKQVVRDASKVFKAVADEGLRKAFEANPSLQTPEVYTLLAKVAQHLEPSSIPGLLEPPRPQVNEQQVQKQLNDVSLRMYSENNPNKKVQLQKQYGQLLQTIAQLRMT
jgi:hypothetical protein